MNSPNDETLYETLAKEIKKEIGDATEDCYVLPIESIDHIPVHARFWRLGVKQFNLQIVLANITFKDRYEEGEELVLYEANLSSTNERLLDLYIENVKEALKIIEQLRFCKVKGKLQLLEPTPADILNHLLKDAVSHIEYTPAGERKKD